MSDYNRIKQMRAFARVDGAYLGLIWIMAFSFFVMQYSNPIMGMVSMLASIFSLFFAYKRLVKFRTDICDDTINFARAYSYLVFTFFYASVILGLAQYIYFKFIDGGYIVNAYAQMASTEEFKAASKAYGMTADSINDALDQMAAVRPVDIALNFLSMNVFGSFFLSIPLAFMARKNETK